MSGNSNPWVTFVKKYAKDHNIAYGCAISEASKEYKKVNIPSKKKIDNKDINETKKLIEKIEKTDKEDQILLDNTNEKMKEIERKIFQNNNTLYDKQFEDIYKIYQYYSDPEIYKLPYQKNYLYKNKSDQINSIIKNLNYWSKEQNYNKLNKSNKDKLDSIVIPDFWKRTLKVKPELSQWRDKLSVSYTIDKQIKAPYDLNLIITYKIKNPNLHHTIGIKIKNYNNTNSQLNDNIKKSIVEHINNLKNYFKLPKNYSLSDVNITTKTDIDPLEIKKSITDDYKNQYFEKYGYNSYRFNGSIKSYDY